MTPRSPTRCWRKCTGPGLVSFTPAAMTAYSGDTTSSAKAATEASKVRLTARA